MSYVVLARNRWDHAVPCGVSVSTLLPLAHGVCRFLFCRLERGELVLRRHVVVDLRERPVVRAHAGSLSLGPSTASPSGSPPGQGLRALLQPGCGRSPALFAAGDRRTPDRATGGPPPGRDRRAGYRGLDSLQLIRFPLLSTVTGPRSNRSRRALSAGTTSRITRSSSTRLSVNSDSVRSRRLT